MNSDSFSSTVYNPTFTTRRNYFATQSAITTASTSNGIFQVNTDSGVNLPFFASVPLQTGNVGSRTPNDINANPAVLTGDFASTSAAPTVTIYQCSAATMATALAAGLSGNAALVAASSSVIAVPGTAISTVGTYAFYVNATLFWDSNTQKLSGEPWGVHTGPAGTVYTTRTSLTGLTVAAYSALNFFGVLSYTGATSVVGCTPTEFSLSAI